MIILVYQPITMVYVALIISGQHVVEEILDSKRPGCPREFENVPIPTDEKNLNPDRIDDLAMPFLRTRYDARTGHSPNNPRQQVLKHIERVNPEPIEINREYEYRILPAP